MKLYENHKGAGTENESNLKSGDPIFDEKDYRQNEKKFEFILP